MSTWNCPHCNEELSLLNAYCEYCKANDDITIYNPDKYYVREIREYHIINGAQKVTLQEELFAELFTKHINILHPWVKDMDILEIRAYRERMSLIAMEGKAAVYAADQAEKEVIKGKKITGPRGFEKSVNTDESTTNAINTIKERQKRMSKAEKIQEGLEKLGISTADAAKLMSAGTMLARLKNKSVEEIKATEVTPGEPMKFNPFKKEE